MIVATIVQITQQTIDYIIIDQEDNCLWYIQQLIVRTDGGTVNIIYTGTRVHAWSRVHCAHSSKCCSKLWAKYFILEFTWRESHSSILCIVRFINNITTWDNRTECRFLSLRAPWLCVPFTVLALVVRLHFGLQVGKSPYTPTYAVVNEVDTRKKSCLITTKELASPWFEAVWRTPAW